MPGVCTCGHPQLEFEPLPLLVQLQDYLETAQFAKFWTHAKELTAYSSMAMGFDDAIRKGAAPCPSADGRSPGRNARADTLKRL